MKKLYKWICALYDAQPCEKVYPECKVVGSPVCGNCPYGCKIRIDKK